MVQALNYGPAQTMALNMLKSSVAVATRGKGGEGLTALAALPRGVLDHSCTACLAARPSQSDERFGKHAYPKYRGFRGAE